ncbi:MAG: GNAT family N-acetyltransferase [Polyangiaceae bacterium]
MTKPVGPVEVRPAEDSDFVALGPLWSTFYNEQRKLGMQLELPSEGFALWLRAMQPGLGRFTCIFVAHRDSEIIGFLAGRVRPLPAYFGGGQVGFISEVFVSETARGLGVGAKMVSHACAWFASMKASRVELQVLTGNEPARRLYKKLGWEDELVEMTYTFRPDTSG